MTQQDAMEDEVAGSGGNDANGEAASDGGGVKDGDGSAQDGPAAAEAKQQFDKAYQMISAEIDRALALTAISAGADVLDVGTGKGFCATHLAVKGFCVTTGEPASDDTHYAGKDWRATAQAMGVETQIDFQPFSAADMPFESGRFGAVFFTGVLHHIDEADRVATVREALRVVRDGAAVFFLEPTRAMLENVWQTDPDHPLAADPGDYISGLNAKVERHPGAALDVYRVVKI